MQQCAKSSNKGGLHNQNRGQGNRDGNKGGQRGQGKHNLGPCYNCQQYGHMKGECTGGKITGLGFFLALNRFSPKYWCFSSCFCTFSFVMAFKQK